MNCEMITSHEGLHDYFTERNFTFVVYHTESGRIITSAPENRELIVKENFYSELSPEDARKLFDISTSFLHMPIFCVLNKRAMIALRSLQSRSDIGVLLVFESEPEQMLALVEKEKLPFLIIDEQTTSNLARCEYKQTKEENISEIYRVALNALYEYDDDTLKTIFSLADLTRCRLKLSKEAKTLIIEMKDDDRADLWAILFMLFMFASRESVNREIKITSGMFDDEER